MRAVSEGERANDEELASARKKASISGSLEKPSTASRRVMMELSSSGERERGRRGSEDMAKRAGEKEGGREEEVAKVSFIARNDPLVFMPKRERVSE